MGPLGSMNMLGSLQRITGMKGIHRGDSATIRAAPKAAENTSVWLLSGPVFQSPHCVYWWLSLALSPGSGQHGEWYWKICLCHMLKASPHSHGKCICQHAGDAGESPIIFRLAWLLNHCSCARKQLRFSLENAIYVICDLRHAPYTLYSIL